MMHTFICGCGIGEQTQEMRQFGTFGMVTCWSCSNTETYILEFKSNQTPEQKLFWDNWQESLSIYREQFKYSEHKPDFKIWHNNRLNEKAKNINS